LDIPPKRTNTIDRAKAIQEIKLLEEQARRIKYNQLQFYAPYTKQREFHAAGRENHERMLGAGNQTGKTYSGSREVAYHLTGLYPDDWEGAVFKKPVVWWVGGVSGEVIRDTTQKLLVGRMQDETSIGSESIPKDCIMQLVKH